MADPPSERSGGRLRGCLLTGCVVFVVLSFVPPVLLWALSRGADEDPGPPRDLSRQHVLPPGPGMIELDVRMMELVLEPAPAGSPLRLEARWTPGRFELEEGLEPGPDRWTYRLRFNSRGLRACPWRGAIFTSFPEGVGPDYHAVIIAAASPSGEPWEG